MSPLIRKAEFFKSVAQIKDLPSTHFQEIALAGRSNVGKSALLNTLVGLKNLAKISSTPGKTQLLNFFLINDQFFLVDLPGYGFAKVSKELKESWGNLIEEYLKESPNLLGIIQILDIRHLPLESDLQLNEWILHYQRKRLVVLTKADKLSQGKALESAKIASRVLKIEPNELVIFSALTKQGKEKILNWIFALK
jgi:GTP-binding protein